MSENTVFGHLPNGEEVKSVRLVSGEYSVTILTLGAIIHQFNVPCRGSLRNIVFSSPDLAGYIGDSSYKGQCVAPYANRIRNAEFCLDGDRYTLDRNNGPNNLHSGSGNLGQKNWNIIFQTDNSVVLNAEHCAMEGGFPGNIGVTVSYLLTDGRLTISYTMVSDADTAVNPTNHSYFNLKGDGSPIFDHFVQICADKVVTVDENLIPVSADSVKGTDFDFTSAHLIGERREGRYDHCFVFSEEKKAVVSCGGLRLTVETDRPGMQLYTGEFNPDCPSLWSHSGPFCALALETSAYPDAVNRPDFPSVVLEKGAIFNSRTSYTVEEV